MASMMEQLEQEIADALVADSLFANVEVHVDAQKNVIEEVTIKIAKLRFLAVPLVATCGCKNPDEPGPVFEPINIVVAIFENPLMRLTGNAITARQLCERTHAVLHLFKPASLSACVYSGPNAIEQVADKRLNIYNCNFLTVGSLTYQMPAAAKPVMSLTGPATTLTCATAGAAIFWTADGSYPSPRNGTLYLGPVSFVNGLTVKARAWLAGYLASDVLTFGT